MGKEGSETMKGKGILHGKIKSSMLSSFRNMAIFYVKLGGAGVHHLAQKRPLMSTDLNDYPSK